MTSMGRRRPSGLIAMAAIFMLIEPAAAHAQRAAYHVNLPAQPLGAALRAFSQTTNAQIIFAESQVRGKRSPTLVGAYTVDEGLRTLLVGADLSVVRTRAGVYSVIAKRSHQGAVRVPSPRA
ncbi:STN domain-containing protein [Caulobacter soli]|uniref:STN domain-containing protein n=1 Tax=Caulobacter soli TaxID=2708539 RepID=UPI0013EAD0AF|nr:STN domain-containing protein [Caulobacter soli]